jgi:protease-4
LLFVVILAAGCFANNRVSLWPSNDEALTTILVKKPAHHTDNRVLLLDIEGPISEWGESRLFHQTEPTTTIVRAKLEKAMQDPRIKAVVLRINSPGGTVTGTDIVYTQLKKYKNTAKVPFVASFMGLAASGGYYVACAADRIYAHPTTLTGSIGVLIHSFGFAGLFQKIGMESRVIKAGKMKDMGNPFAQMSDEERAIWQGIVDDAYERFISVVAEGRPNLTVDKIRELADGRIYTATQAKKLGLVDQIGDLEDAIGEAMRLANIRDAGVILYSTSERPEQNIYSRTDAAAPQITLGFSGLSMDELLDAGRPRFYYMWMGF